MRLELNDLKHLICLFESLPYRPLTARDEKLLKGFKRAARIMGMAKTWGCVNPEAKLMVQGVPSELD